MAASVTIIKSFTYRGAREEFANTYHLDGTPADAAAWKLLADGIYGQEIQFLNPDVHVDHAYGHTADGTPAVWSYDYKTQSGGPPVGTLPTTGGTLAPGDAAMWARWDTGRMTSKGKKIYLRKYFHAVVLNSTGDNDSIKSNQHTALQAYANNMLSVAVGGVHFAGPDGTRPPGPASVSVYATTRTLKRRGKRPPR